MQRRFSDVNDRGSNRWTLRIIENKCFETIPTFIHSFIHSCIHFSLLFNVNAVLPFEDWLLLRSGVVRLVAQSHVWSGEHVFAITPPHQTLSLQHEWIWANGQRARCAYCQACGCSACCALYVRETAPCVVPVQGVKYKTVNSEPIRSPARSASKTPVSRSGHSIRYTRAVELPNNSGGAWGCGGVGRGGGGTFRQGSAAGF